MSLTRRIVTIHDWPVPFPGEIIALRGNIGGRELSQQLKDPRPSCAVAAAAGQYCRLPMAPSSSIAGRHGRGNAQDRLPIGYVGSS